MGQKTAYRLNDAQLSAVTATEGQVMIIAGAGTGKTGVITSRIVHLINAQKVSPENILALTFTEKAASEMEERVDEMMPLSYEGARICTFHSFCDSILRESGVLAGIDPSFKIINQPRQWLLLKRNLFSLGLDKFRPLGNPYKFLHSLLAHFSRLMDEDILPEDYAKTSEERLNAADSEADKEEASMMAELAKAYGRYQQIKMKNNVLDFGDLQHYVLRLFEKSPATLQKYRNRYRYIMVDEYQDTNYAQNKIVMMLAGDNGNIAVVGDDDQSIYKWRGASLSNILSFEEAFPSARKIVLDKNYRSSQKILDASYAVISNNNPDRLEFRAGINKKLSALGAVEDSVITLSRFAHYHDESAFITTKINEIAAGKGYSGIAVLVRANQHAAPIIEAFKDAGVPFTVRDTQSLARFEEIKDLLALLRFINKPNDDVALARILSLEIFDIPMHEVTDIFRRAREDDYKPAFYYLNDVFRQASIPVNDSFERVKRAFDLLYRILEFSRRHAVARILGEFLDKSGYYRALTADQDSNGDRIKRIARLLEIANEFELEKDVEGTGAFLDYIDSMDEAGGFRNDDYAGDTDSVSILTVHSSKGLEFDHVFLPCLVAQRFPSVARGEPFPVPQELVPELQSDQSSGNIKEERRLFYVACTRAKKDLFLSYSEKYEGNKKWKASPFVTEALASGLVAESEETAKIVTNPNDDGVQDERIHRNLPGYCKSYNEPADKIIAHKPSIDIKRLSYSQIDTFKTCALKYKFRYIYHIPGPSAHAANFGSSVHNTVNLFYKSIADGAAPSKELLHELYEKSWIGGGYLSKAHENTRKLKGLEMMDLFFEKEKERNFGIPAFMERNFSLKAGGVNFSGRIDRIDRLDDGTFEVIDYKTGSSRRDKNLKKDLQLSVYALACRDVFRLNVSKYSLYFLEDGYIASTVRTQEDIDGTAAELAIIADEINKSEFEASPGFNCSFCEYRILCNKAA